MDAKRSIWGMVKHTRQNWSVGSVVKDGLPDIYTLESLDGAKMYQFIPHNGLVRL